MTSRMRTTGPPGLRSSATMLAGLAIVGFLLVTAAAQTRPGPRLGSKGRLVDLIRITDARTSDLRRELDDLKSRLASLEGGQSATGKTLAGLLAGADALGQYAGLKAVRGPGVRVELNDSVLRESPTGDPSDLVIHEQDIQAVVNALWAAGAEAIAVNGERITALSAIRCVGNTLLLHGSVYSPPYRIVALGEQRKLRAGLDEDLGVERLRILAEKFRLGFGVTDVGQATLPAFRGVITAEFAEVAA
jgi:uncharacterized protein YlxW (UPF0749 family)